MSLIYNLLKKNKKKIENKKKLINFADQFNEIGKLVKDARMQKNMSIKELSRLSKIPENTLNSIENNIESIRPKYPFIRSILLKLEECLSLRENILVSLLVNEKKNMHVDKKKFLVSKFDFISTWQGTFLYLLILFLIIFVLKRYYFSSVNIIEIQKIEEKINLR